MSCDNGHGAQRIRTDVEEITGAKLPPKAFCNTKGSPDDPRTISPEQAEMTARSMFEKLGIDPDTDPRAQKLIEDLQSGELTITPKYDKVMRNAAELIADERLREARKATAADVKSTGKDGTDVPPLVAEVKQGRATHRFYAANPEDKALMESKSLGIDEALALGNPDPNAARAFPSATTCIGSLDKPALLGWASKLAAEEADRRMRVYMAADDDEKVRLEAEWYAEDKYGKTEFLKAVSGAYRNARDSAANRGTEVHALADAISRGEDPDVPEELQGYVNGVVAFHRDFPDMKYLYTEATFINRDAGSMGTTDAIVELNGKRYILDYKTNKDGNVYDTTGMQLAVGANAESVVYPDGSTEPMPKIDGGLGVGIAPDGTYKLFFFETDRDGANYGGFKAARKAWEWKYLSGKQKNTPISKDDLLG